jgi:cytosine/adenosine deaminase-related metal-dependent hydrolase
MLLQRVGRGAKAMTAREALRLGTRGGASVLGRDDIGYLAPGMAADCVGVRLDSLAMAGGAVHDPLAALVFCRPPNVDFTIVNGKPLVEHGAFTALDIERVIAQHNELARVMVSG